MIFLNKISRPYYYESTPPGPLYCNYLFICEWTTGTYCVPRRFRRAIYVREWQWNFTKFYLRRRPLASNLRVIIIEYFRTFRQGRSISVDGYTDFEKNKIFLSNSSAALFHLQTPAHTIFMCWWLRRGGKDAENVFARERVPNSSLKTREFVVFGFILFKTLKFFVYIVNKLNFFTVIRSIDSFTEKKNWCVEPYVYSWWSET